MKIVVTGANGLLGWHCCAHLHAVNCAANFEGKAQPFNIVPLSHAAFEDDKQLRNALSNSRGVLHFAGVNRASDQVVEAANPAIAKRLVNACHASSVRPHIVYANSTHATQDTSYGRSKRIAGEVLAEIQGQYTELVLPHIFGECARPFYNNVTATLITKILNGETPNINPEGKVQLLHAGSAVKTAIDAIFNGRTGKIEPKPTPISVPDLYAILKDFHEGYCANIFPNLADTFYRDLFNSYRSATYPDSWPRLLQMNKDMRGSLFEAVKGGGGGQCFLSTTRPGVTRGDHFHLAKIERFLVLEGEAVIRIRKVLSDNVWEYRVSGKTPSPVDMPTLHTHSIENVGEGDLLTLFWSHDMFDKKNPDTFFDKVCQ